MGLRQRNAFDGVNTATREDLNLTKYDEKYILPTDGGYGESFRAQPSLFDESGGAKSPVQTPAPDPAERNYVFGNRGETVDARSSVFGKPEKEPSQPYPPYRAEADAYAPNGARPAFDAVPQYRADDSERPMVFVMRDDENMFVYEYSDRLEYYRRTDRGMVHCATKFKTKRY